MYEPISIREVSTRGWRWRIAVTLIAVCAAAFVSQSVAAQTTACAPPKYTFTPLNAPFPGVDQTLAFGINDLGAIVGEYHDSGGPHGFLLQNGKYTSFNVPFPGSQNTSGRGINIFGQIVGSFTYQSRSHGYLLSNGQYTHVDFPGPGVTDTFANSINALGQIVGSYLDNLGSHGFLYDRGNYISVDVPFTGACCTQALGINDRSEIVGAYGGADGGIHGFGRAGGGAFQAINIPIPNVSGTLTYAISNGETVAGAGFFYDRGTFTPLLDLNPAAVDAVAIGINDLRQIVGIYGSKEGAFLMTPQ